MEAATETHGISQLGDARRGKLAGNLVAFGRALRRAGVPVDAARILLAQQALQAIGDLPRDDVAAALEAVLVSREQDISVFRELFAAFFRDPALAQKLLAQMLPTAQGSAAPPAHRPRVQEALAAVNRPSNASKRAADDKVELDVAMVASDVQRLRYADFNQLTASEYRLMEQVVRDIALPLPQVPGRRLRVGARGARVHWPSTLHAAARTGGELMALNRLQRRPQTLPLTVLVDVSGSMERYARLLLAFLHASTRQVRGQRVRRQVFTVGTELTDLSEAFRQADTDAMLASAGQRITDFAGGTRLGESLAQLRQHRAHGLIGRRTLVLIVSDGLDTGEPELLREQLAWLMRHCRRVLWLNPLLRFDGYQPTAQGAALLHQSADAMLAVHNLEQLQQLAAHLAALMRK